MDALNLETRPELRSPVAVLAFAGWNDAASAATNAARFLTKSLGARRFATIDTEDFVDFQTTRPVARFNSRGIREISWPSNEFFYARNPGWEHDLVIGVGVEPNLRWRTFSALVVDVLKATQPRMIVSLGALLADVAHTRPVRVTGTASDQALAARLSLAISRYEGPTGIIGVLHEAFRRAEVPACSLWANVPHYVTTDQNPSATLALLRRLQVIVNVRMDFEELESASGRFVSEVNTAVSANPEMAAYVRQLESAADAGEYDEDEEATEGAAELPSPDIVVKDIEDFLRGQRD